MSLNLIRSRTLFCRFFFLFLIFLWFARALGPLFAMVRVVPSHSFDFLVLPFTFETETFQSTKQLLFLRQSSFQIRSRSRIQFQISSRIQSIPRSLLLAFPFLFLLSRSHPKVEFIIYTDPCSQVVITPRHVFNKMELNVVLQSHKD